MSPSKNACSFAGALRLGSALAPLAILFAMAPTPTERVPEKLGLVRQLQDRKIQFKRIPTGARKSVSRAHEWLIANQEDDGHWYSGIALGKAGEEKKLGMHDTGVTSLAVLALLAGGDMRVGKPARDAVDKGIAWILENRDETTGMLGRRVGHEWIYGHAIGLTALAEAMQVLERDDLKEAVRNAVLFADSARNEQAGWRYDYPPQGASDTSVTAWMTIALVSAADAGVEVDDKNFFGAKLWIESATDVDTGRVGYDSPGSLSARVTGLNEDFAPDLYEPMTGVGLFLQILFGEEVKKGSLFDKQAQLIETKPPHWLPDGTEVDMYAWYYGTLAMYQVGGKRWKSWRKNLEATLTKNQVAKGDDAGSWEAVGPWGYAGGRVYSTAICALTLATPARYAELD